MSVELKVVSEKPEPDKVSVYNVPLNSLFLDREGDLCLRVEGGAISLRNSMIEAYGEEDLATYSKDAFLSQCTVISGHVSIQISLDG